MCVRVVVVAIGESSRRSPVIKHIIRSSRRRPVRTEEEVVVEEAKKPHTHTPIKSALLRSLASSYTCHSCCSGVLQDKPAD